MLSFLVAFRFVLPTLLLPNIMSVLPVAGGRFRWHRLWTRFARLGTNAHVSTRVNARAEEFIYLERVLDGSGGIGRWWKHHEQRCRCGDG